MSSYVILGKEQIPEYIRNKPGWMQCVILLASLLIVTFSAVGIGIPIGYTYCYIEHRSIVRMGNTNATFEILHMPVTGFNKTCQNRSINEALMSSLLVSKILKISHMLSEEISFVPASKEKPVVKI
ncbi:uncharacterized protein LOC128674636 [Plodia interpunctella]|uniref:uncharacterized protein LOC128674636 n=1 Tax=Plodia interpunctella TaxID=58824 RepID=UPI002368E421|nr:uncharacterized protein LOC128674636 [Plodia interpunctella]